MGEARTAMTAQVDRIIDEHLVSMLFQPVVDLVTGATVGYEALARGPAGTPWQAPDELFRAARHAGRVAELDWLCRTEAIGAILGSGLPGSLTWFLNSEPAGYAVPAPARSMPVFAAAAGLRLMIEVTERDLVGRPDVLLSAVDQFRRQGWGIALDDVGAHPESLALLPLLGPDVVKLHIGLVRAGGGERSARIANAVRAYAERTGAAVVAEGVETPQQAHTARVLGAGYTQGHRSGRPGPLPARLRAPDRPLRRSATVRPPEPLTPFRTVRSHRTTHETTKRSLVPMSRYLEHQALAGGESCLVIGSYQDHRHFSAATRRHHARLARGQAYVVAMAVGMPAEPEPGVQGIALRPDDPMAGEWLLVVLGAHFAAALVALDLDDGDPRPDPDRRFTYAITHDRDLVIDAARAALRWIGPPAGPLWSSG